MTLVVPDVSDVEMLKIIMNKISQDGGAAPSGGERLLKLYKNNLTPGKSTVLGDITEVTEAGYAAITLSGTGWTIGTDAGVSSAIYAEQTFTFTTGVSVYGYYVTSTEGSPKLLWVERFPTTPYTLPIGGGEILIVPKFTLN